MATHNMKFALFGNIYQSRKSENIIKITECLAARGAVMCMEKMFYDFLVDTGRIKAGSVDVFEDGDFTADFVISLGGDGTLLRAAGHVGDKGTPILGINMGRLGFLADIVPSEIESAINSLYDGDYAMIAIPMSGKCDSLNVGVAATVLTYEACIKNKLNARK